MEELIMLEQFSVSDSYDVAITDLGWTLRDKTNLIYVLLDLSKEVIQTQISSKIADLQKIRVKSSTIKCKIAQLKKDNVVLKLKTMKNMDINVYNFFSWKKVALELHHLSSNYQAIWKLFYHPNINKKAWTLEEHQKLKRLVNQYTRPNWEHFAKTLNTGRTAYQCNLYFRTNISHTDCGINWTREEKEYLRRIVDFFKEDDYIPWDTVAYLIENHTKKECYNKYMRMIEAKKCWFIPEEDAIILNFVKVYGTNFSMMSAFLTGRSVTQLRVRYNQLLKTTLCTTYWSMEKKQQLMANFPCLDIENFRSRSRYRTLVNWIQRQPHDAWCQGYHNLNNLMKSVNALRTKINKRVQTLNDTSRDGAIVQEITGDISDFINIRNIMDLLNTEFVDRSDSDTENSLEADESKIPKDNQTRLDSKNNGTTTEQDKIRSHIAKLGHGENFDVVMGRKILYELKELLKKHTQEVDVNKLLEITRSVQEMLNQVQERFKSFLKYCVPNESPTHSCVDANTLTSSGTSANSEACNCSDDSDSTAEWIALYEKKGRDKDNGAADGLE